MNYDIRWIYGLVFGFHKASYECGCGWSISLGIIEVILWV